MDPTPSRRAALTLATYCVTVAATTACGALAGCAPPPACAAPVTAEYLGLSHPTRLELQGYDGEAMEPFLSPDSRWLFFNNRNEPGEKTDLHLAERVDDTTFAYLGPLDGANSSTLDGVPTLTEDGTFYFVSARRYGSMNTLVHRGRFASTGPRVEEVSLVPGMASAKANRLIFDVEVSRDGQTLYFAEGDFSGSMPVWADLVLATREGDSFRRLENSAELLAQVNSAALEYAAAISPDQLELFFTRAQVGCGGPPSAEILRSTRARRDEPFGPPERVAVIESFAEGPTLSSDGKSLYYHRREASGRFALYRVTRR